MAPHRPPRRRARSASGQDVVVGQHPRDLAAHDAREHHAEADPDRQRHRPDRAFQGGDEHEREDQASATRSGRRSHAPALRPPSAARSRSSTPSVRPIRAAISTEAAATSNVVLAPTSTCVNRSLPPPSVPNQCSHEIGCHRSPRIDPLGVVGRPDERHERSQHHAGDEHGADPTRTTSATRISLRHVPVRRRGSTSAMERRRRRSRSRAR